MSCWIAAIEKYVKIIAIFVLSCNNTVANGLLLVTDLPAGLSLDWQIFEVTEFFLTLLSLTLSLALLFCLSLYLLRTS